MKRKKKIFYTRLLKESHHTLAWPAKLSCPLRKSLPTNGKEMSKTAKQTKQTNKKKTIRQKRNEKKAKMNEETFKSKTNLCSLRELRTFSKDKKLGT